MQKRECYSSGSLLPVLKPVYDCFLQRTGNLVLASLLLIAGLVLSTTSYGQKKTDRKIDLNFRDQLLSTIFESMEQQANITISYEASSVNRLGKTSIVQKQITVAAALDLLLKKKNLQWKIVDDIIMISAKPSDSLPATNGRNTTGLQSAPPSETAQDILRGRVVNDKGEPLDGITIIVKGTKIMTLTNANGEFTLQDPPEDAVLVFTGTAIETFEKKVQGRDFLSLKAQTRISQLQDIAVVSTGYQKTQKRRLIGAVSTVNGSDLADIQTTGSFEKSLSGRVAGVYIRSNGGRPGESGTVQIRGINTLTGNREPLWVLDGMPLPTGEVSANVNELLTRGLGNIPPEDIESISILKDATASAIYGARAANGVVVITTKQGRNGKNYLSYSGRMSVSEKPVNKFHFMNTAEKVAFERSLFTDFKDPYGGRVVSILNSVEKGNITEAEGESQIGDLMHTNTNWMDVIMRRATSQSHVISLSGGNDKTQYYASLNYSKANGVLKTNNYENAGLNIKLSNYVRKNLLVRFNLYSTIKRNKEGQSAIDPFTYASFANPYEKPFNADGSYASDLTYVTTTADVSDPFSGYDKFNILNELSKNTKTDSYGNARAQLGLEYTFLKNFRFTTTGAFNYSIVQTMDGSAPGTYRSKVNNWMKFVFQDVFFSGVPDSYNNGFLRESSAKVSDYSVRSTFEYNKNINRHFVQLMVAGELGGNKNNQFFHLNPVYYPEARIAGYPDIYSYFPSTKLNLKALGGTDFKEERSASLITSGSYSYDNRYVFNGSFRNDGVSILGNRNQFSPLWSAGLQWNMHNEDFLKNNPVIDRMVLRAGFGYRGSINKNGIYPFSYYSLNTSGSTYNGVLYGNSITYGNPVLKWEKKQNKDAGLEMSFFKGRINTELSYFHEKVIDLLDQVQVAASGGRTLTVENASSISNKGFELSLRVEAIKSGPFLWEIGANISKVRNKVLKTFYSSAPSQTLTELNFNTKFVAGYPVDSWFGLKYSGIDKNTGHLMAWAQKQVRNEKDGQVFYTYEDKEIDVTATSYNDIITQYRPYYLGSRQPDCYGGFQSRFVYRNWDLFAGFSFASGNKIQGFNERWSTPDARSSDTKISRLNRLKENEYRWRSPGDITNIPQYYLYANAFNSVFTDYDLESGSYLKCQSISLGYRLPKHLMERFSLSNAKIGLSATNVFTLSSYSGTDPETQTAFGYPNTRMFSLSIELGL
ncbi:MAG: SusC/RagA family TonB-linked outer membrane protein [Chitinophagaceae bacterium]|nr:SusC/RagA family TonB-linked outer membrane protein [Chitinophagaceae bacterium]